MKKVMGVGWNLRAFLVMAAGIYWGLQITYLQEMTPASREHRQTEAAVQRRLRLRLLFRRIRK